jgi:hypothetical protein
MTGQLYMTEMVGSGVALFDYDNDGDLDVFLVQGGPLGRGVKPDRAKGPTHRLFRNDLRVLPDGRRVLKFTDVTKEAGLDFADYGMGVIAGDFDGDGWVDLYVTAYGRNRLLRNNGNGTFTDVTATAGVGSDEDSWHTSAAWVDYDRDGLPDLFVCRYVLWDFDKHKRCSSPAGNADYCGPMSFDPARSILYHNLGGGRFADVSMASHIGSQAGSALGVLGADLNGDGWPDFFVANDGRPNHLWINRRDGTFAEEAYMRGTAVNSDGNPEANMGLIAADFSNHGLLDLFITHIKNEHSTFYRNLGGGAFEDATQMMGIDGTTRPFTGFGAGALDYDNDGWLDIFATNGEVRVIDAQVLAGLPLPMRQRSILFHNSGGPKVQFEEVKEGAFLKVEDVGRGAAFGDLDNDGATDIVVTNNNAPVRVLLNQAARGKHWIGLRLTDGAGQRRHDVPGAVVRLFRNGKPAQMRRAGTDGSYLSSSDPRVLFGLGESADFERIVVRWPDGLVEEWHGLAPDRYHELCRGSGLKSGSTD